MTVGNINIEETIKGIQQEIAQDKSLSPGLINSINLLIMVIQLLVNRINGVTSWLHVLANSKSTLYFAHEKRGKEAMDLVNDFYEQLDLAI